jgi:hypothetical protein
MFSGLVQGMAATIHLQWGIAVLIIAGVSLIVAGILSHDTETLPQLFAANRLQFIGGGVGVAVLFLVIASLSTILPHAAAQAVSQSTPNTNPFAGLGNGGGGPTTHDTPAPDPKVASMRKAVSVGILEKGFRRANYEEGTYSDKFTAKLQYHNLSSKIIVGFKGLLVFYDQFGERVQGFRVESQDNLRPGHMLEEDLLYDYNQFMHEDQKLRDTPLSKLRVIWQPVRVNFSDGSSLSSDDG